MPGDSLIAGADPLDSRALFDPLLGRSGIGVAVSGGPDSLALMLLVAAWRKATPHAPPVYVYSVDHGLRPEAAAEVAFVLIEAQRLGLEGRGLRWEAEKPSAGMQAAARVARYRLIAAEMERDGAELLLTAHHLNDQAETVLMRLAHGSGIEGLGGMAPYSVVEGCEIYRPLLGVAPEVLHAIVAKAGLRAVQDPSNHDQNYERVRWRRMLPQLAALGLDAARLATFARRMSDAEKMIAGATDAARATLVARRSEDRVELQHAGFADLPRPVAVRLLRQVLADVGGNRKPRALQAVEALCDRLAAPAPLPGKTLHGCIVASDGRTIVIRREPGRALSSGAEAEEAVELRWRINPAR